MQEFMILPVGASTFGEALCMDSEAVSEFLTKDAKYKLNFKNQPNDGAHVLSSQGLCELYKEFVKDFSIVSIEDPFDQNDWSSWESLQSSVDIQLVNQTGTVTKSIQVALDSKVVGWGVMISHRSGETEDNFITDLYVGLANGQDNGRVKPLISFPCFMSHASRPAEVRDPRGLTEDLIRISVGIEYVNDLIDDLDYALKTGPS
ncbi:Enolase 1, chloroplastic [Capsicum annuum]|uniref:phosphopyruvate hydratase n=1 Tax=Capsicum annuum TaxID=4072 RepID=A0A2G2YK04_CAPAN|nr:Enolase 1, chloroplastic [Capsicum annuum]